MFSFVFRKSLLQNRNAIARSPTLKRAYATHPEQNDTKPANNNGMILGLIAAAGLGYYFFMRPGPNKNATQAINEKMDQAKDAVGDKVEQATQAAYGAKDRYDQAKLNAKDAMSGKVEEAKDKYSEAKGDINQKADEVKKEGEKQMDVAKNKGQEFQEKAGQAVKEGAK